MTKSSNERLSRRSVLLNGVGFAAGAATMLAMSTDLAMASKLPKGAVSYQDKPHGNQKCSNCALFEPPHSCKSVAGSISPNGWCRIYRKA